ncbi:TIGR01244 family sulfur transferase [Roseateles sp. NT4]|uniref:TIGR01244 family sulfur transferase n=1 Tax=Roseateles sp. NT4 TaxID=3453715 RepID=UPI003EEC8AE6
MSKSSRWTSHWALLGYAVLAGFGLVLGASAYSSHQSRQREVRQSVASVEVQHLAARIDLAPQLPLKSIGGMRGRGYTTVIDLRPDGEDAEEPASTDMAARAKASGIKFHYVPVPHGDIPEAAVDQLRQALAQTEGEQVLLYCRSGRRAARTWALVESGRPGGLSVPQILEAVKAAGQDATDLRERLEANLARRASSVSAS